MNALTYEIRSAAAAVAAAKPVQAPTKGFFARVLDALIEARMRQAQREIRMHLRHVSPEVLAQSGFLATYKDAGKLPFVK